MLVTMVWFMITGGYGKPSSPAWRGGGDPADLFAYSCPAATIFFGAMLSPDSLKSVWSVGPTLECCANSPMFSFVDMAISSQGALGFFLVCLLGFLFFAFIGTLVKNISHPYLSSPSFLFSPSVSGVQQYADRPRCLLFTTLFIALLFAFTLKYWMSLLRPSYAACVPLAALLCVAAESTMTRLPMCKFQPPRLVRHLGTLPEGASFLYR